MVGAVNKMTATTLS